MELDFAILADGAQVRQDGKLDIYGAGFDTIWATDVPALHARFAIALRFSGSPEPDEQPITLQIEGPDDYVAARAEGLIGRNVEVELPPGHPGGGGSILNFENLVFRSFGEHYVRIRWGDGHEHAVRFFVAKRQAAP